MLKGCLNTSCQSHPKGTNDTEQETEEQLITWELMWEIKPLLKEVKDNKKHHLLEVSGRRLKLTASIGYLSGTVLHPLMSQWYKKGLIFIQVGASLSEKLPVLHALPSLYYLFLFLFPLKLLCNTTTLTPKLCNTPHPVLQIIFKVRICPLFWFPFWAQSWEWLFFSEVSFWPLVVGLWRLLLDFLLLFPSSYPGLGIF